MAGILATSYSVTHLLANLGWVDFDLECSTLCLVLPGSAWANGKLAELAELLGKMVEHPKPKSTQPRFRQDITGPPCTEAETLCDFYYLKLQVALSLSDDDSTRSKWDHGFKFVYRLTLKAGIVALKHISRILGHCNNPTLFVSHFEASI